jgi:hypothetical protein
VHVGEGALAVGAALDGRGAWLCRDTPGCIELAERRRAFSRALRCPVTAEAVEHLRVELQAGLGAGLGAGPGVELKAGLGAGPGVELKAGLGAGPSHGPTTD